MSADGMFKRLLFVVLILVVLRPFEGKLVPFTSLDLNWIDVKSPTRCSNVIDEVVAITAASGLYGPLSDKAVSEAIDTQQTSGIETALRKLLASCNDTYTYFLPRDATTSRFQSVRGEQVGTGLKFMRVSNNKVMTPISKSLHYLLNRRCAECAESALFYCAGRCLEMGGLRESIPSMFPVQVSLEPGLVHGLGARGDQQGQEPAEGLKDGDMLWSVNSATVNHWPIERIHRLVDGTRENETVRVVVSRPSTTQPASSELLGFNITTHVLPYPRPTIDVKSTAASVVISISEFSEQTCDEVGRVLNSLQADLTPLSSSVSLFSLFFGKPRLVKTSRPLVFDLRSNTGGSMPAALSLAARFLSSGTRLLHIATKLKRIAVTSTNPSADVSTPIAVLVNRHTASSSEIFTAALQHQHRCVCAGERTMGKDVAQALVPLSDGSSMSLTVASFTGPTQRSLSDGIIPDVVLNDVDNIDATAILYNAENAVKSPQTTCNTCDDGMKRRWLFPTGSRWRNIWST